MTRQGDRETLQVVALTHVVGFCRHCLISLSQHLNVLVVRAEFTVRRDTSAMDLRRQIGLLSERSAEVTLDYCLNEWHEFATEMIGCFLWHFGGQVIYTCEQDIMLLHIVDLPTEALIDGIVEHEGLLDRGEVACKLDRTFEVCRDISHTHQLAAVLLYCFT